MRWLLASLTISTAAAALFACTAAPAGASRSDSNVEGEDKEDRLADFKRDGSAFDSAPPPSSALGKLRFMPSEVYSGNDGEHTFQIPIAVYDSDADLEVTTEDTAALEIKEAKLSKTSAGDSGKYFLITTKKAGTFTLAASSKGKTTTATVTVHSYELDSWKTGETRYKSGGDNGDPACTRCHAGGAAIDHSPATMASAKDGDLSTIIQSGLKPGPSPITGVSCDGCSALAKQHRWSVSDEERRGLIAYLRSLAPRGFE